MMPVPTDPRTVLRRGLIVVAALVALTALVYWGVSTGSGLARLDNAVLTEMVQLRTPELEAGVTTVTLLADKLGMSVIALTGIIALSLWYRSWMPALFIAASAAGSVLLTVILKTLFDRSRPPHALAVPPYEYSGSFPSGHTLNAVVVIGAIAYLVMLRQRRSAARVVTVVLSAVFILVIGVSRIYLGHHWLTDVVGAIALGLACLACAITVQQWITVRRDPPLPHQNTLAQ